MSQGHKFKVIIAGGGVIGLTLANALEKAGIDYVLLEKRTIAPDLGASIGILCHNSMVYEQLGMFDKLAAVTLPLLDRLHFNEHGYQFEDGGVLKGVRDKTNRPVRMIERRFLLQTLFDNLGDKTKVRSRVGAESFVERDDGVTVTADNGEKYEASILIGADGANSAIRKLMAQAAAVSGEDAKARDLMSPFAASYRAVYAISKNINSDTGAPFMANGAIHTLYDQGVSGATATGVDGLIFWFLFVKNVVVTHVPNCPSYSEKDVEATIEEFGHLEHGRGYSIRDLWNSKIKATMFPMEEGMVKGSWNNGGRVVLVGDSVSKATINAGLGGNAHVEAVCHLANAMVELLACSSMPSTEEITEMFQRYENQQRQRAQLTVTISGFLTRYEAMETWWARLLTHVMRLLPESVLSTLLVKHLAAGPLMNFLPAPDP
ncbi:hypothetical protein F5Y18DRAFT_434536 [Xylariaceae sp. FL1019]|nr:hypothetical protein F5Y18DRAFT_434536 [Xylariaceae sp. FL1019]